MLQSDVTPGFVWLFCFSVINPYRFGSDNPAQTAPASSARKVPMDKASEAILALRPVTFRYKKEIDPDSTPQFGLVAEQEK